MRSASRCSARSPPTRRRATSKALATSRGRKKQAAGLVEGFQVAFTSAAILVTVGAIILALMLRSRDVANVNPEQGLSVPA